MSVSKAVKEAAQDAIMQRLADMLLIASEEEETPRMIEEIRKQAIRVGKMFGYTSWPGIGQIGPSGTTAA
jgi:hypothetical protein